MYAISIYVFFQFDTTLAFLLDIENAQWTNDFIQKYVANIRQQTSDVSRQIEQRNKTFETK
jgi:hypothetical protein